MIVQNVGHGGATDLSFTVPQVELGDGEADPRADRPRARRPRDDHRRVGRQGLASSAPGIHNAPGYAARMFGTLADAGVNIEMISTSEIRITCIIAEDAARDRRSGRSTARSSWSGPKAVDAAAASRPTGTAAAAAGDASRPRFLVAPRALRRVGSTNDVVRDWLADGEPEVCLAVADEQTAGPRPRRPDLDRAGRRRLLAVPRLPARPGSRPIASGGWPPRSSLAMADAAEEVAGLPPGTIRLKWPNDLVLDRRTHGVRRSRKLAGVLGETDGLGTADPRVDRRDRDQRRLARERDFPPELAATMTSLRDASGGSADRSRRVLLDAFLARLEAARRRRCAAAGSTPRDWSERQVTTGRDGRASSARTGGRDRPARSASTPTPARSSSPTTRQPAGSARSLVGEIRHVRLAGRRRRRV